MYRSSPQYSFYIFSRQIYLIIFLDFISPSSFIPPQNVVYFLMLSFFVHKIFTSYINGVLNCKCPAPGPKAKCALEASKFEVGLGPPGLSSHKNVWSVDRSLTAVFPVLNKFCTYFHFLRHRTSYILH